MEKIEKFSAIELIKNNYKYVLSILATIIMAVILYTNAVDLPKKFLVLLFLIASSLIIFLPRKIEYADSHYFSYGRIVCAYIANK